MKKIEEYSSVTGGGITIEKEGWLKVKKIGSIWEDYGGKRDYHGGEGGLASCREIR